MMIVPLFEMSAMEIDPSNQFHHVVVDDSFPLRSSSFSTVVVVVVALETSVKVPKLTIKSPLVSSHHCDYLPMMLSLPVQITFEEIFVPL